MKPLDEVFIPINGAERSFTSNRFLIAFGIYRWTRLMIWARTLDDALDEALEWLAVNEPDVLCDEEVKELYEAALAEGKTEEAAMKLAETDTLIAGDGGYHLNAEEWTLIAENPSRAQVKELQALYGAS